MKKLFTLLGAGLLLGMSTASANTVNFSIYSSDVDDVAEYVSIVEDMFTPVTITGTSATVSYDEPVNLTISSLDPSSYYLVMSVGMMQYEEFNQFAGPDVASLLPNSDMTKWDLYLAPDSMTDDQTFQISLMPVENGTDELNATLKYISTSPSLEGSSDIYSHVIATASKGSVYVDNNEIVYSYEPPVTLTFTPRGDYKIQQIMVLDDGTDLSEDYTTAPITPNGAWTVEFPADAPNNLELLIDVYPYSGGSSSGGEVEKTVTFWVDDDNYSMLTIFAYPPENPENYEILNLTGFTEYTYYDAKSFTLIANNDNEYSLEVECNDLDLNEGTDYFLNEDDGAWFIELTEATPDLIGFRIFVVERGTGGDNGSGDNEGDDQTTVYFNVDGLNGLENAYEHISVTYFGINMTPTEGNVNLTSGSTQFICTPYISFQVTPEAGYEITEIYTASEYASASEPAEGKTTWDLSVNPGSTSNIFFNINVSQIGAVPPPVTREPNVTLNFLGEGVVKGLTVTYTDIDAPVNNGIYSPTKTPFEFPVSSKNSSFTVAAAGYNIAISGASSNGNYYTISGNTVSMTEHTSDLTFNVTVTPADVETYSATFNFVKGAEELIKVLNPAEDDAEVEFSGASYVFDYTGTAGLVFAVEEENYAITVECTNYTGTNAPYSVEYYGTDGLKPQATVTLTPEADGLVFNVSVIEVEAPATESSVTINFTGIANAQNYVVVREMVEEEVIDVVSNSYTYAFTDFGGLLFTANEGYTLEVACTNYKGDADDAPFSITGINPLVESDEPGITSVMLTVTSEADGLIFEVTVSQDTTTGIAGIEADANGNYNVYGINGVNVMNTNNAGELKNLNKGLYIINGKKVSIRK